MSSKTVASYLSPFMLKLCAEIMTSSLHSCIHAVMPMVSCRHATCTLPYSWRHATLLRYYISKMLEFVDTLLMVLRKKDGQVTFLHLYHHSTMFPLWWIGVSYVAGGNSVIGATTNSVVHVIMYSYYFFVRDVVTL